MMRFLLAAILLSTSCLANAGNGEGRTRISGEFDADKPWQEATAELPAAPEAANLRQIYVSAVATNSYFVDESTLSVGEDKVVRYVLVVEAAGGARNISFEGMHCETGRWKHLATGRADGSWVRPRVSEWREIENKPVNRHHAALSRDYFCPNGGTISKAEEGRRALRRGKHPDAS